jgi:hypothetical protein
MYNNISYVSHNKDRHVNSLIYFILYWNEARWADCQLLPAFSQWHAAGDFKIRKREFSHNPLVKIGEFISFWFKQDSALTHKRLHETFFYFCKANNNRMMKINTPENVINTPETVRDWKIEIRSVSLVLNIRVFSTYLGSRVQHEKVAGIKRYRYQTAYKYGQVPT